MGRALTVLDTLATATGRECGPCTVCCTALAVHKIPGRYSVKPPGVTCAHVSDVGCAVYARRPIGCRAWFCGWRLDKSLEENERPDLCGYVVITTGTPLRIDVLREDALVPACDAAKMLARAGAGKVHVIAAFNGYGAEMPTAVVEA